MLRDAVPVGECGRALVVKLRHHGDVLLAAPVLTTLKSHALKLEIDALLYDDTAPMFEGHPALSELHVVGRNWKALGAMERFSREMELFGRLRARRYDLLVHLSEQPRGAWLARTLGARYSVAPATPGRGRFWAKSFTHLFPVVGGGRRHQVELNLDALRRVGVQPSLADRKVVFVPGKQAEARASRLAPEGFIHMHPASRWTFKCWPAEKNAELIDRFASEGHQVVLTSAGDPAELDMVQKIVALARAGVRGACCASIPSMSETCGATGRSRARRARRGDERASTSCSRTSASRAATSTARATACIAAGSACDNARLRFWKELESP